MTQFHQITSSVFKCGDHLFEVAQASVRKTNGRVNGDTVFVLAREEELAVLVAAGATGNGFGDVASRALGNYFADSFETSNNVRKSKRFLIDADSTVRTACTNEGMEADTTGIVLSVSPAGVEGASVGDSRALIFGLATYDLTAGQRRSPRLGNGAYPEDFKASMIPGDVLVVATDGLWNMVKQEAVRKTVLSAAGLDQAVATLIASARNSSGEYSDDVSVVCVRMA